MDAPMLVPRMALLVLVALLLLGGWGPRALGQGGIIRAGGAEVFELPQANSQVTGRLPAGSSVRLLGTHGRDWLAIGAPPGAFDWIDNADIDTDDDGRAWVTRNGARTRLGRDGAKMPGPFGVELRAGTPVRLVERPPLVLKQPGGHRTWVAIEPPVWEPRFIRVEGVKVLPASPTASSGKLDPQAIRAATPTDRDIPDGLVGELSIADALHQAAIRDPLPSWNLQPVLKRYQELRRAEASARGREILDSRINEVEAEIDASDAAREFQDLVRASRDRDAEVAAIRQLIDSVKVEPERRYKAQGLLQPSSKRVDGVKVPALISSQGKLLAYLQVPVGLDLPNLIGKKVGVNGSVRYDEDLKARLIIVRDIEPLDQDR